MPLLPSGTFLHTKKQVLAHFVAVQGRHFHHGGYSIVSWFSIPNMQKPITMYHTSSRFSQKSSLVGRTWLRSICLPGCSRNRFDWDFTINWGDGMGMGRGEAVRVFTKSSPTTSFTAIFWLDFTRIHISITA